MFDDFRQQAEESEIEQPIVEETTISRRTSRSTAPRHFLGMTALQRFIIALMLLMMVCISGSFFLLVIGSVAPPFLF